MYLISGISLINIGKNGVVKDKAVHREVVKSIYDFSLSLGFKIKALSFSPIKGPEGNIEYLIYLKKTENNESISIDIKNVVENSHKELK